MGKIHYLGERDEIHDFGAWLNSQIDAAKRQRARLLDQLDRVDDDLEDLLYEKRVAQLECDHCEDCSMCLD